MKRLMSGVVVAGLVWGGLAVPAGAVTVDDGVAQLKLEVGDGPATDTFDVTSAGDLVVSASAATSAESARTLTAQAPLDPLEDAEHGLYVASAAAIDATLRWDRDTRIPQHIHSGHVGAAQTVVEEVTPTAAGPLEVVLDWDPEIVTGAESGTAPSPVSASSSQQNMSSGPPDLFGVNAPGDVVGTLSWPESTVPPRNLDLELSNVSRGETYESVSLTDNPEVLRHDVPAGVTLGAGELYSFDVVNSGTESHEYTLAWEYPRLAALEVALYAPDGQLVDEATEVTWGHTLSTDVPEAHEGGTYRVEITSTDHQADYVFDASYYIAEHAQVELELVDRLGDTVASASGSDGEITLPHVAPGSGDHTWRIRNIDADFGGDATQELAVPSYALEETVLTLGQETHGGVLPAGTSQTHPVDVAVAGPLSTEVTWDGVVGGIPIDETGHVGDTSGDTRRTTLQVTDEGPIEAALAWEQPVYTIEDSGEISAVSPLVEFPVPVRRAGWVEVSLSHPSSLTTGFVLELLDPDGNVVAERAEGIQHVPNSSVSLAHLVTEYTDGDGDYTLRVRAEGTGGEFDVRIDYPTTADLGLILRQGGPSGDVVAAADGPGPLSLAYDHTSEPTDYVLAVTTHHSTDYRGADYTLSGTHPGHAPLRATLETPAGAQLATTTGDDGTLQLDTDTTQAGEHRVVIGNESTTFNTPSYDATSLATAGTPAPVDVTLTAADGTQVAALQGGQTETVTVDAGTYDVTAISDVEATAVVTAYLAFDVAIDTPTNGLTVFADEQIGTTIDPDVEVDHLDVIIDGRRLVTVTDPSYDHTWDTNTVNDGVHALTVAVTDVNGRISSATTGVTVANALSPDQRMRVDHDQGRLTDDEYVKTAYEYAGGDDVDADYADGPAGQSASMTAIDALARWQDLDSATRDWLVDYMEYDGFTPPERQLNPDGGDGDGVSTASHGDEVCPDSLGARIAGLVSQCAAKLAGINFLWNPGDFVDESHQFGNPDVPDRIETVAEGMLHAETTYQNLGYTRSDDPLYVYIGDGVSGAAHSLPGVSVGSLSVVPRLIIIDEDAFSPEEYFGAHEMFHQYQYDFFGAGGLELLGGLHNPDVVHSVLWWMEATAEWATHQWADDTSRPADDPNRLAYHNDLEFFLDNGGSEAALDNDFSLLSLAPGQDRSYGSFVVAEWASGLDGPDTIRQVWEEISPFTDAVEALDAVVGLSPTNLTDMWEKLYLLDIPGEQIAETDQWRLRLSGEGVFDPARMERRGLGALDADTPVAPVSGRVGPGGVKVVEFKAPQTSQITVSTWITGGDARMRVLPLAAYDTDPNVRRATCDGVPEADPDPDTGVATVTIPADKDEPCEGFAVLLVNTHLTNDMDYELHVDVGQQTGKVIDTGDALIGIDRAGYLGVQGQAESAEGNNTLAVRLKVFDDDPLTGEADDKEPDPDGFGVANPYEGWGVHDVAIDASGYAHGAHGLVNAAVTDLMVGSNILISDVRSDRLVVEHYAHPTSSDHLVAVRTTVTNDTLTPFASGHLDPTRVKYRRVMDWNVNPQDGPFGHAEHITIGAADSCCMLEPFFNAMTNGTATPDPSEILIKREDDAAGTVEDHGPGDFGAAMGVAYDDVPYQGSVEFLQYFGAAPSEAAALQALSRVGAENWVLAQPRTTEGANYGTPNTFIWGFRRITQP